MPFFFARLWTDDRRTLIRVPKHEQSRKKVKVQVQRKDQTVPHFCSLPRKIDKTLMTMTEPTWTSIQKEISKKIGEDVEVSAPINQGSGRNIHVTYLITTGGHEIRRRYSDFQWLYSRLLVDIPGSCVPIIPHKRTAFSGEVQFSQTFVEERKVHLNRFMKGVFRIPHVKQDSPSLKVFLLAPIEDLESKKREVESTNPSLVSMETDVEDIREAKRGIQNILAKAKTVTRNKLVHEELVETENQERIAAIKAYTNCMEQHVKDILAATGALIQSTNEKLIAMNNFGTKIAEWKMTRDDFLDTVMGPDGRALDDHEEISKMMSSVAFFSAQIEGHLSEQQIAEREKFEEALKLLSLDVQSLKVAIKTRKRIHVAFTAKQQQIQQQQKAIQNGKRGGVKLHAELTELEKESSILQVKLEESSNRVVSEAKRVRPYIEVKLKHAIRDFAKIQMEYAAKTISSWSTLMPKLLDEGESFEVKLDGTVSTTSALLATPTGTDIYPAPSAPPPPLPMGADKNADEDEEG